MGGAWAMLSSWVGASTDRVLVSGGAGRAGPTRSSSLWAAHEVVVVDLFANAVPSVVEHLIALTGRSLDVRSFDLLVGGRAAV